MSDHGDQSLVGIGRIALRVMLWSIAISALLGVLAVLFAGDIALEILLSGVLTASSCLLAAGLSRLAHSENGRASVLLGLGVIVAEYVVLLLLIWKLHEQIGLGHEFEGRVVASCWNVGLAGFAGVVLLLTRHGPAMRIASWIGLGATVAASIVGFVAIWGVEGDDADRMGFSALTIAATGGIGLLCVAGRPWITGPTGGLTWRWVGLAGALGSLILGLLVVWGEFRDTTPVARALTICIAVGLSADHANLVGLLRLPGGQRWIARVAWGAVTVALAGMALLIHNVTLHIGGTEWISRIAGAAGIVGGCGTLACVVLHVVQRKGRPRIDHDTSPPTVRVECPRCLTLSDRPLAMSKCACCGLMLTLRTEAPACIGCGYSLAGLRSDVCPECGRRRDIPLDSSG